MIYIIADEKKIVTVYYDKDYAEASGTEVIEMSEDDIPLPPTDAKKQQILILDGGQLKYVDADTVIDFPQASAPVNEFTRLTAKVTALTQSNQILEDCLVEMASIVYA